MANPNTEKTSVGQTMAAPQTGEQASSRASRRRRIRRRGPQPRLGFRAKTEGKSTPAHGESCGCPVCQGLVCLERPNFFSGQLLSEAELNSQQAYVQAKNRLHNRYLHGWGVVCGLEVVCHACEGWVTIRQGYAIDPCGEDILVCQDYDYNLIGALQDCLTERRRRRSVDCDPYRPRRKVECPDDIEHWCITIAYEEKRARPIAALRQVCPPGQEAIACEPTRILESYRIDIIDAPPECCEDPVSALRPEKWEHQTRGRLSLEKDPYDIEEKFDDPIEKRVEKQVSALFGVLGDTLLERVVDCVVSVNEFLLAHMKKESWQRMLEVLSTTEDIPVELSILHQDLMAFDRAVCLLYEQDPLEVQCAPLPKAESYWRPDVIGAEFRKYYVRERLRPAVEELMSRVIQYAIDCASHELLPVCPPSPPDERLILACVEVQRKDNEYEILRICNTSCRRYAGAFPSLYSWMSLVPVVPLISQLVKVLCYTPVAEEAAKRWPRGERSREFFRLLAGGEYGGVLRELWAELRRALGGVDKAGPGMEQPAPAAPLTEAELKPVVERMAAERTEAGVRDYLAQNFGELINAPLEQQVVKKVNERLAAEVGGHVERAVAEKTAGIDQQIAAKVGESLNPAVEARFAAGFSERLNQAMQERQESFDERVATLEVRFSAETANQVDELKAKLEKALSQMNSLKKEMASLKKTRKGGDD